MVDDALTGSHDDLIGSRQSICLYACYLSAHLPGYVSACLPGNQFIYMSGHLSACLFVCLPGSLPCLSVGFTHGAPWTAHGCTGLGYCDTCTLLFVFHNYACTLSTEQLHPPFVEQSNPELNTAASEICCDAGRQGEGSWPCCEPADGPQHEGRHDQIPGSPTYSTSTAMHFHAVPMLHGTYTTLLHCPALHRPALYCPALHCRVSMQCRR